MPAARVRRPLIALIALIIALVIGYSVRAAHSHDSDHNAPARSPHPSVSQSR